MTIHERRRAVRAPAKLAMEIKVSGSDEARVESLNVSANGVYFVSSAYIPTLTKLQITLLLPSATDKKGKSVEVACDGVVVRTEPEVEVDGHTEYQVACYFTNISDANKERLETYILNQLTF